MHRLELTLSAMDDSLSIAYEYAYRDLLATFYLSNLLLLDLYYLE